MIEPLDYCHLHAILNHTGSTVDMENMPKVETSNGHSRPLDIMPGTGENMTGRGQWSNKLEFVLSHAGEIIGLGNV